MARSVSDRRSRSAFRCGAARRQHGFRRVGQLPPQPVNPAPTGRLLIVEVDADTGVERQRWRHATPGGHGAT